MSLHTEWFESWFDSRFYPILYNNRDHEEASLFIENLAAYLDMPVPSKIVDIACGEGRFAQQLSKLGHEVVGLDLSEQRIRKAQMLQTPMLHFYVHDMRQPFYVNYFDYAFNFFTSFGYFDTARDNMRAAHAFSAALKPQGTLVIDYLNKTYTGKRLVESESLSKEGIRFDIKRYIDKGKIVKEILVTDLDGQTYRYEEKVTAFEESDFVSLFAAEGLTLVRTFGDYELRPFENEASPRMIMVFRKNGV